MHLIMLSLCFLLVHQTVWGIHLFLGRNYNDSPVSLKPQMEAKSHEALFSSKEISETSNASIHRMEESNTEISQIFNSDNTSLTDENNYPLSSSNQSLSSTYSTSNVPSTASIHNMETVSAIFNNESHSQSLTDFSSSESSAATNEGTMSGIISSVLTSPSNNETNASTSTTDDDESEGVARGKPSTTESVSTTTAQPQSFYGKTLALIGDPYTLSILVPVVAGVVFATTVILTIATCRCLRRKCIRRRLRRKALPDSVKNLRPSDRARLLAESSDEEF